MRRGRVGRRVCHLDRTGPVRQQARIPTQVGYTHAWSEMGGDYLHRWDQDHDALLRDGWQPG
jgi:hypothetical protein